DAGRYSYKDVRRWTTPKKLESTGQACSCVLDCDMLLFPVHCGTSHWAAACIDLQHKCLYFWDSLGSPDIGLLGHLAHWVADEAADKLKERGPEAVAAFADATTQWERISPRNQVPQQNNCCDCGVFCIKFIECASAGSYT
ncbi:ULP_PROTEASE domain-containing protein, partial [Haematococcus lacustris]